MPLPRPDRIPLSLLDAPGGVAGVGSDLILLPHSRPPSSIFIGTFASQVAMLAATRPDATPVQSGDYCNRSDFNPAEKFTYQGDQHGSGHTNIANWHDDGATGALVGLTSVDGTVLLSGAATKDLSVNISHLDGLYDELGAAADVDSSLRTWVGEQIELHRGDAGDIFNWVSVKDLYGNVGMVPLGTAPYYGKVLPSGSDTYLPGWVFPIPQGLDGCFISMICAKYQGFDGTVQLGCSSGSDDPNQIKIGDSPNAAPTRLLTPWLVPAGIDVAFKQRIVEVPLNTDEAFKTDALLFNAIAGRAGASESPVMPGDIMCLGLLARAAPS